MRGVALFCLALPVLATGCLHEPADDAGFYQPAYVPAPQPVVRSDVSVSWAAASPPSAPLAPAASPLVRVPDPIPFRIGAGHGALGLVDLSACRAQGLEPGYVRMRVTFRGDGRIVHAAVESPTPPPQAALDCVAAQLEDAQIPAFDGRDASLSRSFYVEAGGEGEDVIVRKAAPGAGGGLSRLGQLRK